MDPQRGPALGAECSRGGAVPFDHLELTERPDDERGAARRKLAVRPDVLERASEDLEARPFEVAEGRRLDVRDQVSEAVHDEHLALEPAGKGARLRNPMGSERRVPGPDPFEVEASRRLARYRCGLPP